jgi:hypothetical protein
MPPSDLQNAASPYSIIAFPSSGSKKKKEKKERH